MNEQGTVMQAQPGAGQESAVLDRLEALPAEELKMVIMRAQDILARREREERDKALEEIQKIAREHGLKVSVQDPKRKRGRPRKKGDAAKAGGVAS